MSSKSKSAAPMFRSARSEACEERGEIRGSISFPTNANKILMLPARAQATGANTRLVRRRVRVFLTGWTLWIVGTVWMCITMVRLALAGSSIPFSWTYILKSFADLQCLASGICICAGALMIAINRAFVYFDSTRVDAGH